MQIRKIEAGDEADWRRLWAGYCSFYEADLSSDVTARTWRRLLDPAAPVHAIVAVADDGALIGLANYVIHENTWELKPVCYLEDLFVDPAARAQGTGRALIGWLKAAMQSEGWSRLYWMTRENNYRARGLYDKFTPRDAFVRYVIKAES
ncbi:MAG TPA: GNAT family N-acetyltransferase [Burkholderiales bacterium]|jgi:GNAT superfamily N-acetyltransferase